MGGRMSGGFGEDGIGWSPECLTEQGDHVQYGQYGVIVKPLPCLQTCVAPSPRSRCLLLSNKHLGLGAGDRHVCREGVFLKQISLKIPSDFCFLR